MTDFVIKTIPFYMLYLERSEQIYLINISLVPLSSNSITSSRELIAHRHKALINLPSEYYDYVKSIFSEVELVQALPFYRGHIDHYINLVDGFSPVFS